MADCRGCGTKGVQKTTTIIRDGVVLESCPECSRASANMHKKVSTFPFTMDFGLDASRKKLTINSLHHLRKVERDHKVLSHLYNNDERNSAPPRAREQPGLRG